MHAMQTQQQQKRNPPSSQRRSCSCPLMLMLFIAAWYTVTHSFTKHGKWFEMSVPPAPDPTSTHRKIDCSAYRNAIISLYQQTPGAVDPKDAAQQSSDTVTASADRRIGPHGIEKKIHLTSRDSDRYTELICGMSAEEAWGALNPGYTVYFYDNSDVDSLMHMHRPSLYRYWPLLTPVEIADLFRYLIVFIEGGHYADIDVVPVQPIGNWMRVFGHDNESMEETIDFVFGVERRCDEPHRGLRDGCFLNWQLGGRKSNPILDTILTVVEERVADMTNRNSSWAAHTDRPLHMTGPGPFAGGILRHLVQHCKPPGDYNEGNKIGFGIYPRCLWPYKGIELHGQIVEYCGGHGGGECNDTSWRAFAVPQRGFGYHVNHDLYRKYEEHLVEHQFRGSWKKKRNQTTKLGRL